MATAAGKLKSSFGTQRRFTDGTLWYSEVAHFDRDGSEMAHLDTQRCFRDGALWYSEMPLQQESWKPARDEMKIPRRRRKRKKSCACMWMVEWLDFIIRQAWEWITSIRGAIKAAECPHWFERSECMRNAVFEQDVVKPCSSWLMQISLQMRHHICNTNAPQMAKWMPFTQRKKGVHCFACKNECITTSAKKQCTTNYQRRKHHYVCEEQCIIMWPRMNASPGVSHINGVVQPLRPAWTGAQLLAPQRGAILTQVLHYLILLYCEHLRRSSTQEAQQCPSGRSSALLSINLETRSNTEKRKHIHIKSTFFNF